MGKLRLKPAIWNWRMTPTRNHTIGDNHLIGSVLFDLGSMQNLASMNYVLNFLCIPLIILGLFNQPLHAQQSISEADSLITVLNKTEEDTSRANILYAISQVYYKIGDLNQTMGWIDSSLALSEKIDYAKGKALSHMTIGNIYNIQGNFPKAIEALTIAKELFKNIGDKKGYGICLSNVGLNYYRMGSLTQALPLLREALLVQQEIGEVRSMALTKINIGNCLKDNGQKTEAMAMYTDALSQFESINNKKGMADATATIAFLHLDNGDYVQGLEMTQRAMDLKTELGDKRGVALAQSTIGLIYFNAGELDKAIEHIQISLSVREALGDKYGVAKCHSDIATVKGMQGKNEESDAHFKEALDLYQETGFKKGLVDTYISLSNVDLMRSNFASGLEKALQIQKLIEEQGLPGQVASFKLILGTIYLKLQKDAEAMIHFRAALEIGHSISHRSTISSAIHFIGRVYQNELQTDSALVYFNQALILAVELGLKERQADIQNDIAGAYQSKEEYEEALVHARQSLELWKEIGRKDGYIASRINMGLLLARIISKKDSPENEMYFHEALSNVNSALLDAASANLKDHVQGGYQALSEIYKSNKDYANALEYQTRYITLKDSLLNNESTRKLEQLSTQYEVEKAIMAEKIKQDSLLTAQKFLSEKEQAEINARHTIAIAEAKAEEEKAIEIAKVKYQLALSRANSEQEKKLAEQQYQSELKLADENASHQLALADEKRRQESIQAKIEAEAKEAKANRKRINEIILAGVGIVALVSFFLFLYYRQRSLKQKAIERAETIHQMAELELQSLRAQLNPHFMFNSLNAIQELILLEDNDRSHMYLARFAKLLRMLLENANSPFIPLAREIEFLELYLSLEKLRIPDLNYIFQIDPSIHLEKIKIPNMILQPYIENAIWHGLSNKTNGDRNIAVKVIADQAGVRYDIEDNGVGRKRAAELKSAYKKEHKSKGMELLSKRFRLLNEEYQSKIETEVVDLESNLHPEGTRVSILVPWSITGELKKLAS